MSNRDQSLELFFKALADRTRLRLINLIRDDEVCVCSFVEVLQTNQSKISRHLAYLRRARIVSARREGKWMHYRLNKQSEAGTANILRELRLSLERNAEMQKDRARLERIQRESSVPRFKSSSRPARLVA